MTNVPQKDITVSIILTESTASLFNLDIPHLEDVMDYENMTNVCAIKPIENLHEVLEASPGVSQKKSPRSAMWHAMNEQNTDSDKVLPELAYYSKRLNDSCSSIDIIDDLSDETIESEGSPDGSNMKLDKFKLYTRPLVAIKTVAHQNKLNVQENKIFVSILDSELTITGSGWVNVCRICHGGASIGNLLAPCRCRGSVALAHMSCLERWLKESSTSRCELCQHHYKIVRQPKYEHPGDHFRELLFDFMGFIVYTPSAVASTYMLMLLCETIAKNSLRTNRNVSSHVMAFAAIFARLAYAVVGMAAIDFTYSSWLIITLQKHADAWRAWYRSNCDVKLILPPWKQNRLRLTRKKQTL